MVPENPLEGSPPPCDLFRCCELTRFGSHGAAALSIHDHTHETEDVAEASAACTRPAKNSESSTSVSWFAQQSMF